MQVWTPERKLGFASLSSTLGGGFFLIYFMKYIKYMGKCIVLQTKVTVPRLWSILSGSCFWVREKQNLR